MELFLELELLLLKMVEDMKECGKIIKWMDMELLFGQMIMNLRANLKKIKKKDLVFVKWGKKLKNNKLEGNVIIIEDGKFKK